MPRRSHTGYVGLEIFAANDNATEHEALPPDSERYQILETLIHNALALLETSAGRESLVQVARLIIRERNADRDLGPHLYVGEEAEHDLDVWVNHFLKCMRRSFPEAHITKTLYNADAQATRIGGSNTMASFNPRNVGTLYVNRNIISNMVLCRHIRTADEHGEEGRAEADLNYALYKFHMTVTVAHEIIHFLTAFITGEEIHTYGTPPNVLVVGYGQKNIGEAGRYWENLLLGGILETYSQDLKKAKPKVIKGSKLAGDPYLIEYGSPGKHAYPVSMSYISRFNRGEFSFPIETVREAQTTKGQINLGRKQMSDARTRHQPQRSPPRDSTPSIAYRRSPQFTDYYYQPTGDPNPRPSAYYSSPAQQSTYYARPQQTEYYAESYREPATGSSSRASSSQHPAYYSGSHHDAYYYESRRR